MNDESPEETLPTAPYADLSPAAVLDALDGVGLRGDGRMLQLNSYENRVFQAFLEDGRVVVAKFYRPGRWSDAQIIEEHTFAAELVQGEIPVAAPIPLDLDARSPHVDEVASASATLARLSTDAGATYRFGVTERRAGRAPELEDAEVRRWLGRYIGRLHAVGAVAPFKHRMTLDVASYGEASSDFLLARRLVSDDVADRWRGLAEQALAVCRDAFAAVSPRQIRLHGDCHPGNIL